MAKDPAINWYFDNWLGGTKGMNRLQKACYFDILTAQYYIGHLSLEQIKNELGGDFHIWASIKHKFKTDESGNYYNDRMDAEILKRSEFSKKQSEKVKKRWGKSPGIYSGNTAVLPNNETEIEIGTSFSKKEEGVGEEKKLFLTEVEVNQVIEFAHITLRKRYDATRVKELWEGFLIQNKDQPSSGRKNEKYRHFLNWLKFLKDEKNVDGNRKTNTGNSQHEQLNSIYASVKSVINSGE